ncbi:hypothetical protein BDN70DRAFT_899769 [Pholiota conissans]|uniref:Uncharacterized protein n=1 Tax=Pholiota conissans TaxID=109636 RepID=A0A9P5YQ73_9AGAR|nr:hypothetical protein BDN70DRAFT_899769 [Pholiota conissans]
MASLPSFLCALTRVFFILMHAMLKAALSLQYSRFNFPTHAFVRACEWIVKTSVEWLEGLKEGVDAEAWAMTTVLQTPSFHYDLIPSAPRNPQHCKRIIAPSRLALQAGLLPWSHFKPNLSSFFAVQYPLPTITAIEDIIARAIHECAVVSPVVGARLPPPESLQVLRHVDESTDVIVQVHPHLQCTRPYAPHPTSRRAKTPRLRLPLHLTIPLINAQ